MWLLLPLLLAQSPTNLNTTFDTPEGTKVELWSESPALFNPTAIDIDGEGRVWVAEAVNYRQWNGRNPGKHFDAGDRIVVLEDTDGDGHADKSTVFVQDVDLTAPLGILVLEDRVLVSCSPNLYVYRDLDGDLKADTRETLLTGFGGFDHDHGLHSFAAHPDGSLIWAAGNAGPHIVEDQAGFHLRSGSSYNGGGPGNPGNRPGLVSDDQQIWTGGLVGRLNLDGTGLRIVAHNFRNIYEAAVDSYGDMYTEDNDDDGNRSCRTVSLIDGGNYGYFSADGSRFWGADRRPNQETVAAHWHQDDPGVMPHGTINGGGGPTGVTVYEGYLMPQFHGMVLDADAGRSLVFTHTPRIDGAALILDPGVLIEPAADAKGERGHWFRPSDVAVGPDGSIYISDWYDPGVGGHAAGDRAAYGRILRISPQDLSGYAPTVRGLDSPNAFLRYQAVRASLADESLHTPQSENISALTPAALARRFWIWAQRETQLEAVGMAMGNANPRIRLAAFRAWQSSRGFEPGVAGFLSRDESPFVRAHFAASLRDVPWQDCQKHLMRLANGFDGKDRTYLEALGIGAQGKEAELFTLLQQSDFLDDTTLLPFAWRLHPPESLPYLAAFANNTEHNLNLRQQALTGIAFQPSSAAADVMLGLALSGPEDSRELASWWIRHRTTNLWRDYGLDGSVAGDIARADEIWSSKILHDGESANVSVDIRGGEILWLTVDDSGNGKGYDWASWINPHITIGDETLSLQDMEWFEATAGWGKVQRNRNCEGGSITFNGEDRLPGIGTHANSRIGFRLPDGATRFRTLCAPDDQGAKQPNSNTSIRFHVLLEKKRDSAAFLAQQESVLTGDVAIAKSMAKDLEGALFLIEKAAAFELPDSVLTTVEPLLRNHQDLSIRALADGQLPTTVAATKNTAHAFDQVAGLEGSASRGRELFRGRATCFACHSFDDLGGSIGPDLSSIRQKLGAGSLLQAIVEPSDAIAFGYDSWTLTLLNGQLLMGSILADGETIVLRDTAGRRQAIDAAKVLKREHHSVSLMPSADALNLSATDLADLLAFLLEDPDVTPNFAPNKNLLAGNLFENWQFQLPDGTDPSTVWSMRDEVLRCEGLPIGYLYTKETYTDFELELDWRGDPAAGPGNSGVLLRVQEPHKVWPHSIEAQLHSGNAADIWNIDDFPMLAVADRTSGRRTEKLLPSNEKPLGEWNHYRIRLVGGNLELEVNGQMQNTAKWCAQIPGVIALQSEGAVIEFRNVMVRRIMK